MIWVAGNDGKQALAALESANELLEQQIASEQREEWVLARADCCVRLSRLCLDQQRPAKSIAWATEAETLAGQVIDANPNVAAYAVLRQAQSCLGLAHATTGDTDSAIEVLRSTRDHQAKIPALLPTTDAAIYKLACDYFSQGPPLLATEPVTRPITPKTKKPKTKKPKTKNQKTKISNLYDHTIPKNAPTSTIDCLFDILRELANFRQASLHEPIQHVIQVENHGVSR